MANINTQVRNSIRRLGDKENNDGRRKWSSLVAVLMLDLVVHYLIWLLWAAGGGGDKHKGGCTTTENPMDLCSVPCHRKPNVSLRSH